jgi:hypothetical protein
MKAPVRDCIMASAASPIMFSSFKVPYLHYAPPRAWDAKSNNHADEAVVLAQTEAASVAPLAYA